MNLDKTIRRILSEETNAKLYILRRYSFEELESIFNQKLQNQSINFKHYENKSLDFFSNSIVKTMTETILEELTNGWVEESPVSEESLHDFIKKLFEDKIIKKYEELQDIHIEIYDVKYGFNVLIMMGDEKIGEIVFEEADDDINYTIIDAKIDPQYRKKGLYQKAIIKVFEVKPNIIINSVFRSPEAERSWELLVSKLPDNIEYKTKYYREEQTRLHQLRLKNDWNESLNQIRRRINMNQMDRVFDDALNYYSNRFKSHKSHYYKENYSLFKEKILEELLLDFQYENEFKIGDVEKVKELFTQHYNDRMFKAYQKAMRMANNPLDY